MKNKLWFVFAIAFCALFLGCNKNNVGQKGQFVTIVDHADNEVTVPVNPHRIVVCDVFPLPSVLAIFFDSAEKLVGIAPASMVAAKNSLLSELYPEILNAKTDFIKGNDINIEELLKLNPEVVFYSATNGKHKELLEKAGLNAVGISANKWDYNAIETLTQWIGLLSKVFPKNDKSELVKDYSNKIYDFVQKKVENIPAAERVSSFVLFQCTPTNILTSGKHFFGQWWTTSAGSSNVAESLEGFNGSKVNLEQIYAWNPDVIFVTNFTQVVPSDLYENKIGTYDWSKIKAVENKRVYKMPLGMYRCYTPGIDTPITLLWFAKTLYPAYFADVDLVDYTVDYYKSIFGVNLSEEQVERIFTPQTKAGNVSFQK